MSNRDDIDALVYLLNRVEEEPDPLERIKTISEMNRILQRRRIGILRQSAWAAQQDGHSIRSIMDASGRGYATVQEWLTDYRYTLRAGDDAPPRRNRRRGPWKANLWQGATPPAIWSQDATGGQE